MVFSHYNSIKFIIPNSSIYLIGLYLMFAYFSLMVLASSGPKSHEGPYSRGWTCWRSQYSFASLGVESK